MLRTLKLVPFGSVPIYLFILLFLPIGQESELMTDDSYFMSAFASKILTGSFWPHPVEGGQPLGLQVFNYSTNYNGKLTYGC